MKRLNILIIALLGIFAITACDSFLNVEPTNSAESSQSIKTAEDAQVMINGIMSKMTSSNYYGRNMILYSDAKGGDLTIYSQGRGGDALYTFNHSANSSSYSGFWTTGYNILLQINNLLANIEKVKEEGSPENFDSYKGQALTLRALLYFDLVRLYGVPYTMDKSSFGVPDIAEVLDASAQPTRATIEQNYTRIISDLNDSEGLLSKSKSDGYVNYYANKAIQARVYLTMGNNEEALKAAQAVIDSKAYTLYSNNEWVDSWKKQFGSESIFELAMYDNEGDLKGSSLGAYYCRAKDYTSSTFGYFGASTYFINRLAEDPTDVRHGIMSYDEFSKSFDSSYATDRMGACYKYLGGVSKPGDGKASASAVNIKVIRLSEMYLIAAEAALASDKKLAASYLQEIRKRAPGLEEATKDNITLDMILDEKSKEFFGEGQRFFDMIRLNKSIEFDDDTPGITPPHRPKVIDRTFGKIVLPISESEILANPALKEQQNPAYK